MENVDVIEKEEEEDKEVRYIPEEEGFEEKVPLRSESDGSRGRRRRGRSVEKKLNGTYSVPTLPSHRHSVHVTAKEKESHRRENCVVM